MLQYYAMLILLSIECTVIVIICSMVKLNLIIFYLYIFMLQHIFTEES